MNQEAILNEITQLKQAIDNIDEDIRQATDTSLKVALVNTKCEMMKTRNIFLQQIAQAATSARTSKYKWHKYI